MDVRYVRENGLRLADYEPDRNLIFVYEGKSHELDKLLGKKLSVFQSIYEIPDSIVKGKIEKNIFPEMEELNKPENLTGYIVKYNPSEILFYSPKQTSRIIRLYKYLDYKANYYSTEMIKPILVRDGKIYLQRL